MLLSLRCNPEKQKFVLFFDYFVIIIISAGEASISQFKRVTKVKVKTMREIYSVVKTRNAINFCYYDNRDVQFHCETFIFY